MNYKINLIGLCCAQPQMLVYSKVKKLRRDDMIEIIVERGSSQERDVLEVLRSFGIMPEVKNDGEVAVYIVRRT